MTEEHTARRLQLGRALKDARKQAGLTQSSVADRLNCTQGKINKIETTLVAISRSDLDKMLALYRLPPERAAELSRLAVEDRRRLPGRTRFAATGAAFGQLSHLEPDATEILCWHSERIPGPLQSEHYMLQQHPGPVSSPEVTALLRQQKARARIFTLDDPPWYRAILSESSLLRVPGGRIPELIADQAEHLVKLMNLHERLTVQILPFEAEILFVDSDFQVLRFANGVPDFAYIEYPCGSRTFKRPTELKQFEDHWQQLHAAALDRAESAAFLLKLAKKVAEPE